jgi:hypothetical protein
MKNRFYITEEDKKNILNQHKNYVNEQALNNLTPGKTNMSLPTSSNKLNVVNKVPQFQVDPKVQELINTANKFVADNPKLLTFAVADIENYLNYSFKDNPAVIPYAKAAFTSKNPKLIFPDASQQVQPSVAKPSQEVKIENIQPGVFNQKVQDLQKKLNEKFKSGLIEDGKWGPKTSSAVAKALKNVSVTPANTTTPTTQTPVNTTTAQGGK